MCGLVGMCGTLDYKHKKVMCDLLFLDSMRGRDSTGLACVKRNREIMLRKQTVPGYEFVEIPSVYRMMDWGDMVWLGHNRFKTQGEISRANAHPFEVLDEDGDVLLVGAHNGSLNNKWEVEKEIKDKFDTDSEGIFHLLAKAPNFKEAISGLKGAWSLVFWDATTDRINFIRNKERPLVYAFTEDRKVLIWASEAWMLIHACARNDVKLLKNEKGLSCYATIPDNLYYLEVPQEKDKPLEGFMREGGYVGATSGMFRSQYWWGEDDEDDNVRYLPSNKNKEEQSESEKGTKETTAAEQEDEKKIIEMGYPPQKRGFKGEIITAEKMAQILDLGCVWCGDDVTERFAFVDEGSVVCSNCLNDKHLPSGDRVHPDVKAGLEEDKLLQKDSPEHKRLLTTAVEAAKKAVG